MRQGRDLVSGACVAGTSAGYVILLMMGQQGDRDGGGTGPSFCRLCFVVVVPDQAGPASKSPRLELLTEASALG